MKSLFIRNIHIVSRFNQDGQEKRFVSNVREYVFHIPKDGFSPIFRIKESPVSLFISDKARQALKEAEITEIEYESLQGLAYSETRKVLLILKLEQK